MTNAISAGFLTSYLMIVFIGTAYSQDTTIHWKSTRWTQIYPDTNFLKRDVVHSKEVDNYFINLVNEYRSTKGLGTLQPRKGLDTAAAYHCFYWMQRSALDSSFQKWGNLHAEDKDVLGYPASPIRDRVQIFEPKATGIQEICHFTCTEFERGVSTTDTKLYGLLEETAMQIAERILREYIDSPPHKETLDDPRLQYVGSCTLMFNLGSQSVAEPGRFLFNTTDFAESVK